MAIVIWYFAILFRTVTNSLERNWDIGSMYKIICTDFIVKTGFKRKCRFSESRSTNVIELNLKKFSYLSVILKVRFYEIQRPDNQGFFANLLENDLLIMFYKEKY